LEDKENPDVYFFSIFTSQASFFRKCSKDMLYQKLRRKYNAAGTGGTWQERLWGKWL
jgi:hypothetical protein